MPKDKREYLSTLFIWESLIWPLSPRIVESADSNLTIGALVERGGSEHQS